MCHTILFAVVTDSVYLVLHQRDERADDDCYSFHQQAGELVAQALSSSGRHQDERIVASDDVLYDGLLVSLEGVETEVGFQHLCQRVVIHFQRFCYLGFGRAFLL